MAARHFDISHFKKMSKLPSTPKDIRKENNNDTAKSNQSKLTKSSLSLFRIPKNIKGSIILSIDTISYKNGLVRDLTFNALFGWGRQAALPFPSGSEGARCSEVFEWSASFIAALHAA